MLTKVMLMKNIAPNLQFDWSLVPDHILFKSVPMLDNEMSDFENVDEDCGHYYFFKILRYRACTKSASNGIMCKQILNGNNRSIKNVTQNQ
jgi:hypothetical protein